MGRQAQGKSGTGHRRGASRAQSSEATAAFLSERLAERWYDGQPLWEGPAEVGELIARFTPRSLNPETWARIEGLVRDYVARTEPPTIRRAKTLLNALTQLAVWAHTRGQPLQPDVLLHPDTIDRFILEGLSHLESGTQTNYRSQLRAIGGVVLGPTFFPPKGVVVPRPNPRAPYSPSEVNELVAWSRGLRTDGLRRNARVLLSLGLGAGFTSQEMRRVVGTDVVSDADGVLIHVVGTAGRVVPVLRRWEAEIVGFATEAGERPLFRSDRARISRHDIPNFIERCSGKHTFAFSVQRLRTTWIVNQIAAGVPLVAVAEAAGVNLAQLARYLPQVPVAAEPVVRQQMRDAEGS